MNKYSGDIVGDSSQLLDDTMILSKDKSILTEFRFKKQKNGFLKTRFLPFLIYYWVLTFIILLFFYSYTFYYVLTLYFLKWPKRRYKCY